MVPKALPFALMQQTYLRSASAMASKAGPVVPRREQNVATAIDIEKQDFESRTMLVAPPIVSTRRRQPAVNCAFKYSSQFIDQQHKKVKESKCFAPFNCTEEVISDPSSIIACPGEDVTSGQFFGLNTSKWGDDVVYADFLFSLTGMALLYPKIFQALAIEQPIDTYIGA